MYELSRVRLHAVGPKGARYQDVTLDLRRGPSGQPADASVLFLENGGGKTVLVRLIFSVILPGRRQVVGTSNSKVLEKFVLAGDVAHVALEWQDTRTGNLLVTGKVSEWRGHVVSADSNRLTERWYTFRPAELLNLGTLPFTQDGRIISLAGFHERLDEADKADPALQVRWVDRQGEWTDHLDSLRLDPELFSYQRKMNAGEGEAADAFTFKTDEAFVDWLLTAIIPDEEPQSFGEVVTGYAAKLASRGALMAERDFVQEALDRLGPLAHAVDERTAAVSLHRDALGEAERLVIALAAREGEESGRYKILADRFGDVEVRERGLETDVRRLNSAVIELNRLVARLRWDAALEKLKRLAGERDDVRRLLTAWQATRLVVEYRVAHESAETIRDILCRQEIEAEPLLNARDATARRFARGLLAVADTAEDEARDAEARAEALKDVIKTAKGEQETAIRQSGEASARIEQATLEIANVQGAVRAAVAAGLLANREDVSEAAAIAEHAADEAETRVTEVLTKSDDIAAERDLVGADLEAARIDHETKSRAAEKLGERLAAMQQSAEQLCGMSRLTDLLGAEEIVLDNDVPTLITLLREAINLAAEEKNALQVVATTDQRVLNALGSGGLLPASDHIADALDVLAVENITAWSGWKYLSKIRADERDEVLARYPYLVDGIVLNSGDDLSRAREKLTEARLLPRTVIAVGTSAAIMDTDADKPAGIGFIVPPSPALYDVERAEQERQQIQQRQQARGERLKELEVAIDTDKELRSRLTVWQRDVPPWALAELTDDHEQAVTDETLARQNERELRETVGKLTAAEKRLRRSIPDLRRFSDTARRKAGSLRTLANDHAKIAGWQEIIRTAEDDRGRAEQETLLKGARIGEREAEQREAYRAADSQRRTASDRRRELAHVIGGGSADDIVPVPDEALESLRSAYQTGLVSS